MVVMEGEKCPTPREQGKGNCMGGEMSGEDMSSGKISRSLSDIILYVF